MQSEYGADPGKIIAAIGPTLSVRHFTPTKEVDGFTINDIADSNPVTETMSGDQVGYNIATSNVNQLISAGIAPDNIEVSNIDTYEDPRFYSWERDRLTDHAASMRRNGLFAALP